MPYTPTTLAQLATRVRERADMPDSEGLVSDSELYTYINGSYLELMDLMVQKNENVFTSYADYTQVPPITATQFLDTTTARGWFKILRVEVLDGSRYRPLERIGIEEWDRHTSASDRPAAYTVLGTNIHILPMVSSSHTFRVFGIPSLSPLSTSSPTTSSIRDQIVMQWDDYIVIDAAIKCLRKEEQDVSELLQEKAAMQSRISTALTDRDGPSRVAEVRRYNTGFVALDRDWER